VRFCAFSWPSRASREDAEEADAPKKIASYTVNSTTPRWRSCATFLVAKGWTPFEVVTTRFAFKADHLKVNVSAYTSGKVVIAAKARRIFVRDVIEPESPARRNSATTRCCIPTGSSSHAGLDESGKGDFSAVIAGDRERGPIRH